MAFENSQTSALYSLPLELIRMILDCLSDFSTLLSVIGTCRYVLHGFDGSSKRILLRITQNILSNIPKASTANSIAAPSNKDREEALAFTSFAHTEESQYAPLLSELSLITRRHIVRRLDIVAVFDAYLSIIPGETRGPAVDACWQGIGTFLRAEEQHEAAEALRLKVDDLERVSCTSLIAHLASNYGNLVSAKGKIVYPWVYE